MIRDMDHILVTGKQIIESGIPGAQLPQSVFVKCSTTTVWGVWARLLIVNRLMNISVKRFFIIYVIVLVSV